MDEPEPAVLARQPYDKNNSCLGDTSWSSRTCGGSSGRTAGHWRRTGEVDDTYGTMEWITKQSWSNGAVGMFGDSSSHLAHYWIDNNVYVGHR